MTLFRRLRRRFRALAFRRVVERELSDELQLHIELEQQKNERLGMSADEARRAALVTFGGVERYKEEARDARGVRFVETIAQDLRYALRTMRRTPAFSAIVILTLGLGVGATSAIFSIVNAVLLRPLPYANERSLVRLYSQVPDGTAERFSVSIPDYQDYKSRNHVFSDMAMWLNSTMTLTDGGEPERLAAVLATDNLFSLMGVTPSHGRLFATGDSDHPDVVVLSYGVFARRFGSDSTIVGRRITLDGSAKTVIGVLPPSFRLYTRDVDVWAPIVIHQVPKYDNRANHLLRVIAKLRPGVTVADAQRDVRRIAANLATEYARQDEGWSANVFSVRNEIVGDLTRPLVILLTASALVLLIACINVANLQLTRSVGRGRELAVRRALGAERGRLITQMLVESLTYAACGGLLGIALGVAGTRALVAVAPGGISRLDEVSLDGRVFAFAMAAALLTGILFSLWPAFRASDPQLGGNLRDGGRGSAGSMQAWRVRGTLVVAELSLALTVLVGAGLVLQSFRKILSVDLGIRTDSAIALRLTVPSRYADSAITPFYRELQSGLAAIPGITGASAADRAPAQGGGVSTDIRLIERPDANASGKLMSQVSVVLPEYFRTMGMKLLGGRDFTWSESTVAIVNAAAAAHFWPGASALGQHVAFGRRSTDSGLVVVGVVSDVRRGDITLREEPMIYIPVAGAPSFARTMMLVVRGSLGTAATVSAAKRAVHGIDRAVPLYEIRTFTDIVGDSVAQPRLNATLLGAFAALALLLAAVGIYGVIAHSVTQRRQEIGVRVALGAQPGDVFRFVVRQGAALAVAGLALGLVASWLLTPVLRSWLYEIEPSDPLTFAGVAIVLGVVALVATAIPARRAAKVNPVLAMRAE
ncbi:MAG TPA: ABC transporter permease [Gemmatimonadaceae bacterium]|nr:ABC transporter permease [Gemmatimonadaceae bacterium]